MNKSNTVHGTRRLACKVNIVLTVVLLQYLGRAFRWMVLPCLIVIYMAISSYTRLPV